MFSANVDTVSKLRDWSVIKVMIGLPGNPIGGILGASVAKANICAGVTVLSTREPVLKC